VEGSDSKGDLYTRHLSSPEWAAIRQQALARAGNKCQICSCKDEYLEVHHNSYDNLGHEPPEDVIAVCKTCHDVVTNELRRRRYSKRSIEAVPYRTGELLLPYYGKEAIIPLIMAVKTEMVLPYVSVEKPTSIALHVPSIVTAPYREHQSVDTTNNPNRKLGSNVHASTSPSGERLSVHPPRQQDGGSAECLLERDGQVQEQAEEDGGGSR